MVYQSYLNQGDPKSFSGDASTAYYPFGLTIDALSWERDDATQNRFLYNSKELQDELDLGWYDYGARMYDAALGRWHVVDGMAEKYISSSPYHFVANNPILNFDIDGNEFTESAEIWANRLRKQIRDQKTRNNQKILGKLNMLESGLNKKGKQISQGKANRLANQINGLEDQNAGLSDTQSELTALENSDQLYNVVVSNQFNDDNFQKAATIFNASSRAVDIVLPSNSGLNLFAHEAKHAFQFERGKTSLTAHDGSLNTLPASSWFAYDQSDERQAYLRQGLFGGTHNSLPRAYSNRPAGAVNVWGIQSIINLNRLPQNVRHAQLQRMANRIGVAFRLGGRTYGPNVPGNNP